MTNTEQILEVIDKEMRKMLNKSKNKMTKDEFRAFVTEQWEEMQEDKYQIHDAYILIGRMMSEACDAKDPKDLIKWIEEDKKHISNHKNTKEIIYDYYKDHLEECEAFEEGLAFFKKEQNKHAEATEWVNYFQNLLDNPEKIQEIKVYNEAFEEIKISSNINLEQWTAFFADKENEPYYKLLRKDGEIIERHTKQHRAGIKYLEENQKAILENILSELLVEYPKLQEKYDYSESDKAEFMPDIADISGFASLISPTVIYIFSKYKDDLPYVGVSFSCAWEPEHGLGVIIHKDKVIKIGEADILPLMFMGLRIDFGKFKREIIKF